MPKRSINQIYPHEGFAYRYVKTLADGSQLLYCVDRQTKSSVGCDALANMKDGVIEVRRGHRGHEANEEVVKAKIAKRMIRETASQLPGSSRDVLNCARLLFGEETINRSGTTASLTKMVHRARKSASLLKAETEIDDSERSAASSSFSMPPPPKPLSFEMPKPPVLQPNIADILKNVQGKRAVENPFAPRPKSVSPIPPTLLTASEAATTTMTKTIEKKLEDVKGSEKEIKTEVKEEIEPEKLEKPKTLETEIPITPIVETKQITSPAVLEVSSHAETVKAPPTSSSSSSTDPSVFTDKVDLSGGLMSWITKTVTESKLLSDVAEKAKIGMETVMTTLDPGMKPFLAEHGVIEFALFNCDADTVVVASEAFTKAGAMAICRGLQFDESSFLANFRPLVLGEPLARKLCDAKIEAALKSGKAVEQAAIVVVQPFLIDISGRFYSASKIVLRQGSASFDAISQLLEVDATIVEAIQRAAKSEGLPDDEFSISLAQAIKNLYKSAVQSWEPGSLPPYESKELLSNAFSSVAQQLLRALAPVN